MYRLASVAITLAAAAMPAIAPAAIVVLTARLSGAEEVPPAATPGTGTARVTIDTILNTMRVETSFSGLIGNTTASHIHCCQPFGVSAQVATTTPSFVGFPLGVTAGSMDQTYDMTLASSFNPAFVTAHGGTIAQARTDFFAGLFAGQAYLNVHTNIFPGGEIRGQLGIPEPGSWALMIAGFGIVGAAARSQRRGNINTIASPSR
jgi:hypothetical protein